MSKVSIQGDQNGTGDFTIKAPNSNSDRTLNLPDEAGTVLTDSGALNVDPSAPTQSATIDSSGNLLVGTTDSSGSPSGSIHTQTLTGATNTLQEGPRLTARVQDNNGKRAAGVGVVRTSGTGGGITSGAGVGIYVSSNTFGGYSQTYNNDLAYYFWHLGLYPSTDNFNNLGGSSNRFNDIYATNGTIQTSDSNEKQDIDVLSDAETRVAAKAKTLLRKYRWKSAVEEKGDEARIHFGIIAQDLEQAFIDEGLDAGRYGMFIRGEWYEAEVEKTRTVDNDDGTETTETYMATETYNSAEEAPDGAVHKERLGVRYHELLAFIIAAI